MVRNHCLRISPSIKMVALFYIAVDYFVLRIKNQTMTLFVDMDEVIADAYYAQIELYNKDFGHSSSNLDECYGKGGLAMRAGRTSGKCSQICQQNWIFPGFEAPYCRQPGSVLRELV